MRPTCAYVPKGVSLSSRVCSLGEHQGLNLGVTYTLWRLTQAPWASFLFSASPPLHTHTSELLIFRPTSVWGLGTQQLRVHLGIRTLLEEFPTPFIGHLTSYSP